MQYLHSPSFIYKPQVFCHRMTAARYKLFIVVVTLLAWLPVFVDAQPIYEYGDFRFQRYTETDGLVSAETVDTYKDRYGFLWIATFNGISRFDGQRFENYGRYNGLPDGSIDIVGEDAAGRFFIRSVSNIYQYTGNSLHPFTKFKLKGDFIAAAAPAENGNVWIGYDGEAALHLVSQQGELSAIKTSATILQLIRVKEKEMYVLETNGRLSLLKDNKLFTIATLTPQQPYTNEGVKIYKDNKGTVWSYAANNSNLYAYKSGSVIDSIALPKNTPWWQWNVGATGSVYLAPSNGGLSQLIGGQWQQILTKEQVHGSVYEARESADGTIWITALGGLVKAVRKRYSNTAVEAPNYYYCVDTEDQYVLRNDSLLYSIPNAVRHFYELQSQTVTNVYVTRNKEVWYCTEDFVYYLPFGKTLQKLNTSQTYEGKKSIFRFRRVLEDGKGGLWISSYHGIFYKQGDSLRYYFDREGLTEGAIYTIAIDNSGTFYAAGVHVYAFQSGRFLNISPALHLPDEICRLATDQNKNVWISQSTDKLVKISNKNRRFLVADSVRCSLNGTSFSATSHCFDGQNNLWVSDNQSLYCYQFSNGGYRTAPLYWNEVFYSSPLLYTDGNDKVQVISHPLTTPYFRSYPASQLIQSYQQVIPQLQLRAVHLFKEPFNWDSAGFATNVLGVPQNLQLKHNQNFLKFHFVGLTTGFNQAIIYRYRLKGYDDEWSPSTSIGEAEYTGLPPGDYNLEVQTRTVSSSWSPSLFYSFRINQVWYLLWWAKILWATLLTGLSVAIVYYRIQALKRKARVKQLLVEEQLKALRAQINPHFLQNTFAFLAHELYSSNNREAVKAIDRLSVYLKGVLRYSDKTTITLEEELEFAGEYLQMQQQLLSIPFIYEITVADDVDVFDIQIPSMLLQPLIENALKHGLDRDGDNTISIDVRISDNFIRCVISDTGNRHGEKIQPLEGSGKGIALTLDRMKLFYSNKKNKPQFYRHRNIKGGCDAMLMIPLV